MTPPRANPSRRANVARTILKRRDKPYKTERSRILAKKRKLDLRITNQMTDKAGQIVVPEGFRFLPVGTPELANRCRELSRSEGLPVNVVNVGDYDIDGLHQRCLRAKPSNTHGEDPEKLSFHIRRIGYHFHTKVVDQACRELHFVLIDGKFVKEETLREEFQNSTMARAMAKLGLRLDLPSEQTESHDHIRLAIQELFPKIPEEDLEAVIKISWEEGSDKVGMHHELSLARRVQLAVIARIRHVYTDYDQLLAAFKDWSFARASVEKTCLEKLIEWRGENDNDAADDELEEIIRETIVIDDDDDVGNNADRCSVIDLDSESDSDTSLEISYTRVDNEDLRPESVRGTRTQAPILANGGDAHFHNMDIRQKIGYVRQQKREEKASGKAPVLAGTPYTVRWERPVHDQSLLRVKIDENHRDAESIVVNGQLYKKLNTLSMTDVVDLTGEPMAVRQDTRYNPDLDQAHYLPPPKNVRTPSYAYRATHSIPSSPRIYSTPHTNLAGEQTLRDRPIPSIERPEGLYRTALGPRVPEGEGSHRVIYRTRTSSPERAHAGKRRRLAESVSPRLIPEKEYHCRVMACPYSTSRANSLERHMARIHMVPQSGGTSDLQSSHSLGMHNAYLLPRTDPRIPAQAIDRYDPFHPLISTDERHPLTTDPAPRRVQPYNDRPKDSQVAPIQYLSRGHGRQSNVSHFRTGGHLSRGVDPNGYTLPEPHGQRLIYVEAPRERHTPLPLHGAPALVQQIPKSDHPRQPVHDGRFSEVTNTIRSSAASSSSNIMPTSRLYYT